MRREESAVGVLTKDTEVRMPAGAPPSERAQSRQGLPVGVPSAAAKWAERPQRDREGSGGGEAGAGHFTGGNGSGKPTHWMSSTVQPLPLASRYVDVAKNDPLHPSSSSALGSVWIRRFLPSVPSANEGELGPDVVPQAAGAFVERGGGHRPDGPMLLAGGHNHLKAQDMGGKGQRASAESGAITRGNGYNVQRGKGPMKSDQYPGIPAPVQSVGKDGFGSSLHKGNAVQAKTKVYVAEGSRRKHQHHHQQPHEDESGPVSLPTQMEPQVNGKTGQVVTGFGPLRVVINTPVKEFRKVAAKGATPKVANARNQSLPFQLRGDVIDKNNVDQEAEPTRALKKTEINDLNGDQDGLHGKNGKSKPQVLSAPLVAAFQRDNRPEASHATFLTAALPPDATRRLQYESEPAARPSAAPVIGGIQEEREEAKLVPFPMEVQHLLRPPSSHFSSSPWPNTDDDPHDDGYLYPHYSQGACDSGYQSQGSRLPKRAASDSRGQHTSAYRNGGSSGEGSDSQKRPRNLSSSALDQGESPGSKGKDTTDRRQSRAGHLHLQGASERDDYQVPRILKGYGTFSAGSYSRRQRESELAAQGSKALDERVKEFSGKGLDTKDSQLNAEDIYREAGRSGGLEEGDSSEEHGKFRASGGGMEEAGPAAPSKRSFQEARLNLDDPSSRKRAADSSIEDENGKPKKMSSSWLQRWLPSSTNASAKPPPFARPKDRLKSSLNGKAIESSGGKNLPQPRRSEPANGRRIQEWNATKSRSGVKDMSRRGAKDLQSYPTPSAAAMALASTAANKVGPLPQQRRGSFNMWPSVQFQSLQTPDGQQSQ